MRMTQQHVAQRPQVGAGIGGAGRVAGRVQDQPLGPGRDRALEILGLQLEALRLRALHDDRRAVAEQHHLGIGHPVGRRDDHLVAGIERRQHGVEDDLLAARGDDGLRRLVVEAMVALHLGADRLAQRRRAGHRGVLVSLAWMALMAASLMWSGVGKSGSPAARPITSLPAAFISRNLPCAALVGEGLMRLRRSAMKAITRRFLSGLEKARESTGRPLFSQGNAMRPDASRGLFLVGSRRTRVMPRPTSAHRGLDGHPGVAEADAPAADRRGVAIVEADRDPRLSPRGLMPLAGSKPTHSRPGTQASAQEWLVRPTCSSGSSLRR